MQNRDTQILKLQEQIKDEELRLQQEQGFKPKTNTILECFGVKINLRTLNESELVVLNRLLDILTLPEEKISGYALKEYQHDCVGLLKKKTIINRQKKLAQDKTILESLLSEDKKADLLLEQIANNLQG